MDTEPYVRIVVGHQVMREVVLRPPMTFGCDKDNDVVLDDKMVSAQHGRVERSPRGWSYVDCHSGNGTQVAGGPQLDPGGRIDLEPHSQLKLGDTVLDFRLGEDADTSGTSPAHTPAIDDNSSDEVDPASLKPRLLVVMDSGVTTRPLPMPLAIIGRSPDCDVVLEHASVSGQHAEIAWAGAGWTVRDLGSTNGTRVGLVPVTEAHPLVNAAHLIVGEVDLLFLHGGEEGSIAAKELLSSLQRRGGLSRREARQVLEEHERSGRSVEEILLERRLLEPGSLYEMRHDALNTTTHELAPRDPGAATWLLMAAALAAVAWLLMR